MTIEKLFGITDTPGNPYYSALQRLFHDNPQLFSSSSNWFCLLRLNSKIIEAAGDIVTIEYDTADMPAVKVPLQTVGSGDPLRVSCS